MMPRGKNKKNLFLSLVDLTWTLLPNIFIQILLRTELHASAYGKNFVGGAEHNLPEWNLLVTDAQVILSWRQVFFAMRRENTGVQNSANIITMKWEIKRTHLSSKRSMKNDYFDPQMCHAIILCMSFCIVLFAYLLSILITAILLSRSCPIVDHRQHAGWKQINQDIK